MSAKPSTAGPAGAQQSAKSARAEVMASPLRQKILSELNQRVMSVTTFQKAFPEYTYGQVYYQFELLEKLGYTELVETKSGGKRRGSTERFYRATERAWIEREDWEKLPLNIREDATGQTLTDFISRLSDAVRARTIDKRTDRFVAWTDGQFDQQAWDETIEEVDELLNKIPMRTAEALKRMAASGEEPIRVTVAPMCFESPSPRDLGDIEE